MLEQVLPETDDNLRGYRVEVVLLDVLEQCLRRSEEKICTEKLDEELRFSPDDHVIDDMSGNLGHDHRDRDNRDDRRYSYGVLPYVAPDMCKEPEFRSFFLFLIPHEISHPLSETGKGKKIPRKHSASEVMTLIRAICFSRVISADRLTHAASLSGGLYNIDTAYSV